MDTERCDMRLKLENGRNLLCGRPRVLESFEPDLATEIGKAVKAAGPKLVQFVRRDVVAHSVSAVVGEEHGAAVPVEADRVPHAPGDALKVGPILVHADDRALQSARQANVAGRS